MSEDEDMQSRGEERRNCGVVATLCLRDEKKMQDVEFIECLRMLCE